MSGFCEKLQYINRLHQNETQHKTLPIVCNLVTVQNQENNDSTHVLQMIQNIKKNKKITV